MWLMEASIYTVNVNEAGLGVPVCVWLVEAGIYTVNVNEAGPGSASLCVARGG